MRYRVAQYTFPVLCTFMVLAATDVARASCGDYLAGHGSLDDFAAHEKSQPPQPQAPCNGPTCDRGPQLPVPTPTPPPTVPTGGDQFGVIGYFGQLPPITCSKRQNPATLRIPAGNRQRIERPPRVLTAVLQVAH